MTTNNRLSFLELATIHLSERGAVMAVNEAIVLAREFCRIHGHVVNGYSALQMDPGLGRCERCHEPQKMPAAEAAE